MGAAIAYNFVGGGFNPADPDQTNPSPTTSDGITAYIDDSTVNVGGSLTVAAGFGPPSSLPGSASLDIAVATIPLPETISDQVTSVTAAGAGAGTFALGGAINLNFIDNTIDAHISGGSQVTAGSVALGALDSSTIQSLSGQVTVATSTNSGAVGAAVVVNQIDNTIQSYIAGSTVMATAGDVTDEAQSNHNIDTLAAGGAGSGQATLAGSAAVNMIGGTTDAYFSDATVTADGNALVEATDSNTIQAFAGVVAISLGAAAVGGSVVVDELTNKTPRTHRELDGLGRGPHRQADHDPVLAGRRRRYGKLGGNPGPGGRRLDQ